MTVSSQINRTSAVGAGAVLAIPYTFPTTASGDLTVIQRVISTGVETELTETTNYTATYSETGGTVTTVVAVANTDQVHVIRNTPMTQSLDLETGGSFNAENIENALDKNTKLSIENSDALERTLIFPATDPLSSFANMPNSIDRASKNLTFDATGKPTASVVVEEGDVTFTDFGTNMAEVANAASARTLLDLGWIDVREHGAVGDGVTDDAAAIQAAIDAVGSNGGTVFFPAAIYSIETQIILDDVDCVNLKGQSNKIITPTEGTVLMWNGAGGGTMFRIHASERCSISDMTLNANGSSAAVCLHLTTDAALDSTWQNIFDRVTFAGSPTTAGVRLGEGGTTDIAYNTFRDCVFINCAAGVISDSSAAALNWLIRPQFYKHTANSVYGIHIKRGGMNLQGGFFNAHTTADVYIQGGGAYEQLFTCDDTRSEGSVLFLKVDDQALAQPLVLNKVTVTSAGANVIEYSAPTQIIMNGCSLGGNFVVGANVTSIVEIGTPNPLVYTGTLDGKLTIIRGDETIVYGDLNLRSDDNTSAKGLIASRKDVPNAGIQNRIRLLNAAGDDTFLDIQVDSTSHAAISTSGVTRELTLQVNGGLLKIGGALIQDGITSTSGPAAVAITGQIHEITTTGTGDAMTLANGTAGQRLMILYVAEGAGGDTAVITPVTLAGGATITFNALGDCCDLQYSATGGWYVLGLGGTAAVA